MHDKVAVDFEKTGGLVPVIAQDAETGVVLMLAYMNKAAWEMTLSSGKATYYSRSRDKLWIKGESSGHVQHVKGIYLDCDSDTILLKVDQVGGAACHTGYQTCFYREVGPTGNITVKGAPVFDPAEVYQTKKK